MKKTEIAASVFGVMDALPLAELAGGPVTLPVADLAGLSLVPWFCDPSVQWAFRLTSPGRVLKKAMLKKVNDSFIAATEGAAVLAGVPGDGIEPSTYTLLPLAEAIAAAVEPGMVLELATANLGVVKRDYQVRAETATTHGNQRYLGTIDAGRQWVLSRTTPALDVATLGTALDCGRKVARNGPWGVKDAAEAHTVLMRWLGSPEANINPAAVKRFVVFKDGAFTIDDPGMVRKLCGLGLGFFRHRLAGGPFRWADSGPSRHSKDELEEVARSVAG